MLKKYFNRKVRRESDKGLTLVEIIVSVGLFVIVMFVFVGALLALTGANRKAQALQSVMNNLNIALDGMVRSIRVGSDYHCGGTSFVQLTSVADCSLTGDTMLAFKPFCEGGCSSDDLRWVYRYNPATHRIERSKDNGSNYVALTSKEVSIDDMKFYVDGTEKDNNNTEQPKVVITVKGTAGGINVKTRTSFEIQATAVQRLLDL